jgi:hypothetical protein
LSDNNIDPLLVAKIENEIKNNIKRKQRRVFGGCMMIVFLCLVACVALWRAQSDSLLPSLPMELSATTIRSDEEGSVPLLFNSVCEDNRGENCTSVTVVEEEVQAEPRQEADEVINAAPSALEGNAFVIDEENEEVADPPPFSSGIGAVVSASRDGGLTPAIGEPLSSLGDSSLGMIWTLVVALLTYLLTSCFCHPRPRDPLPKVSRKN